ncbi:MAG: hypothetical protein NTY25_05215 [Planctomycetia bacterium]|nr:hypothetical protein [Planctomycetia bacterium]
MEGILSVAQPVAATAQPINPTKSSPVWRWLRRQNALGWSIARA